MDRPVASVETSLRVRPASAGVTGGAIASRLTQPQSRSVQEKSNAGTSRRDFPPLRKVRGLESDAEDDTGLDVGFVRDVGALEERRGGDEAAAEAP